MIAVVSAENVATVTAALEAEGERVVQLGRMIARIEGTGGTLYKGMLAI
jgi:phosphoribosylformylglycinamidine cyclo-ligase